MKNIIEELKAMLPIKQSVFLAVILFIWFGWRKYFLSFFDKHLLKYLDIQINVWTNVSFLFIGMILLGIITLCIKKKYIISYSQIFLIAAISIIYFSVRYDGNYISEPNWFGFLGYSDILIGLSSIFGASCLLFRVFAKKAKASSDESLFKIIPDIPIRSSSEDKLDYHLDALNLSKTIDELTFEHAHSIAIISPWGSGKTSYMNMVKESMLNEKYVIIDFNPRHSKDVKFIQEDFFKALSSKLKVYNGEFSNLFEDYLDAISIIDKKNITSYLRSYSKINGRLGSKNKLQDAIYHLNKRIVVFIEDFDRLLDTEIIEVFKLIDENASFGNIIFISAYDKNHMNKILGSKYNNEDGYFSDKFFTLEVYIPRRPYIKVLDYISQTLTDRLLWNEEEQDIKTAWLRSNKELISRYLPTFRDAKRFLNLFLRDYSLIKEEVVFSEYLLVTLIKYRYPNELDALYNKSYLERRDIISPKLQVAKDCDAKSSDVLKELFPDFSPLEIENYKSIRYDLSFNKYFENYVYGVLSVQEMENILNPQKTIDEVKRILAEWDKNSLQDLLNYLDYNELFSHGSKLHFERYIDLLFLIGGKVNTYIHTGRLIATVHTEQILRVYGYTLEEYKRLIDSKFRWEETDDFFHTTKQLILDTLTDDHPVDYIFSKEEILEWSKLYLERSIRTGNTELSVYKHLLYACISDREPVTLKIILDPESCERVKELIDFNPQSYLDGFIFLGSTISNPNFNSIACEPFWRQIFLSEGVFEAFINNPGFDNFQKIKLVRNFWRLYVRNDFEQLYYENMGNVQDKIDSNLEEEIRKLDNLEQIEREYEAEKAKYEASPDYRQTYYERLRSLYSRTMEIHTPIKYRGAVQLKVISSFNELDQLIVAELN